MNRKQKIAVFTGAGISAESGIQTFRDGDGLWHRHAIEDVASYDGWLKDPELVINFYNMRRREIQKAQPNAAHLAIAKLEDKYDVTIITQNIDDLHERALSTRVIHVHGEAVKARSEFNDQLIHEIGYNDIHIGDTANDGQQLRPHIVWFGESVLGFEEAAQAMATADKVLVVGSSLSVFPVAYLVREASPFAEKVIVNKELPTIPDDYEAIEATATEKVPFVVDRWLAM